MACASRSCASAVWPASTPSRAAPRPRRSTGSRCRSTAATSSTTLRPRPWGAFRLWRGDRTRDLEGAHVEYLRGIANPIGVKVGPTCAPDALPALLQRLNPENLWGRVTLITRLGAGRVRELLPPLIRAVQSAGARVLWSCDPMHGNSVRTAGGVKTRDFEQILGELRETYAIHQARA